MNTAILENSIAFLETVKLEHTYDLANPLLDIYPKGLKSVMLKRCLHSSVRGSSIHNRQDTETILSVHQWMNAPFKCGVMFFICS